MQWHQFSEHFNKNHFCFLTEFQLELVKLFVQKCTPSEIIIWYIISMACLNYVFNSWKIGIVFTMYFIVVTFPWLEFCKLHVTIYFRKQNNVQDTIPLLQSITHLLPK